MSEHVEMLPCPFCGSDPYPDVQNAMQPLDLRKGSGWMKEVWCQKCGIAGPYRHSEELAREAWNTRVPMLPPAPWADRE